MRFILISLLLSLLFQTRSYSQDSIRKLPAIRAVLPVKIDGIPNEPAWQNAAIINDLVEQRPVFMRKENFSTRTEAKIMYDDNAVYISGFNHESKRDSISTELGGRDVIGINDYVGIIFDTYYDQINGVGFFVTALGEQYDAKYSLGNEDDSWSSVYQTATVTTDSGWSYEMSIPYSALRFSKSKIQNWGINFIRRRAKTGQQFSWSPINPNKFGLMSQSGLLTDIQEIKSPVRLSFSPYFSSYIDYAPDKTGRQHKNSSVNGGMDVKYGISKSFTLDMTLVPDFGQVQSDNVVLNLTPFEIRYNEYRPFFTEGTELFNKGNLFYSRRIGGFPINNYRIYSELDKNSTLVKNPTETKLLNATKISGRTGKGLGVGFFNAITKPQHSHFLDTLNAAYKIETSPLTNYNIIVLDQTMKNNSSVSLINTNVLRSGETYDANVTAFLFDLYDKKVDWNIWGKMANSRLSGGSFDKTYSGYNYEINLGKFRGPFNFEIHQYVADDKYEQNDMGIFNNNNYYNYGGGAWYKLNTPKSFYNRMFFQVSGTYSMQYKPRLFQYVSVNINANSQLKNLWDVGIYGNINPEQQDFYEPRVRGKMFKVPGSWRGGLFFSTNRAKKYSASVDYSGRFSGRYKAVNNELYLSNNYRFNDKFNAGLSSFIAHSNNNAGYAFQPDPSYFGLRNRRTVENTLSLKYNFNIKMGITFRARHYWSKVRYEEFFRLLDNGYLQPVNSSVITTDPNNNFNTFNIDMVYTWQFAQGSFINIGWKNAGMIDNRNVSDKYYSNLSETLNTPHQNNLSVKVIYFLDYLTLKNKKRIF